jgi:hypothetical protein
MLKESKDGRSLHPDTFEAEEYYLDGLSLTLI